EEQVNYLTCSLFCETYSSKASSIFSCMFFAASSAEISPVNAFDNSIYKISEIVGYRGRTSLGIALSHTATTSGAENKTPPSCTSSSSYNSASVGALPPSSAVIFCPSSPVISLTNSHASCGCSVFLLIIAIQPPRAEADVSSPAGIVVKSTSPATSDFSSSLDEACK